MHARRESHAHVPVCNKESGIIRCTNNKITVRLQGDERVRETGEIERKREREK